MPDEREKTRTTGEEERKKLAGRAGIVAAGTLLSRLLGLARDVVLAAVFSRDATDAFFVAFTIPNMLRQILGEGAVSSAVMPVLSKKLEEGDEPARAFFRRARGVSLVALVVVTALGMAFARPLTELFASGFHSRPGQFERTVDLTRTVFPYIFFMGSAALGMAALNAKRRFAVAAFAPGLLNVAFLLAAVALPSLFAARGIDVAQVLAAGALVGGLLQVMAQWPSLARLGFLGLPRFDLRDPAVRDMLRRIAPMTFGIGVYYIDIMLSRRFLSELGEGAQSYFTWGQRLADFPQGIFVMAISTAALPSLATLAARGELDEVKKTFAHGMRLSMYVAIPSSVALAAMGEPIIALLFQRGAFDAVSTRETARAALFQGGAIFTVAAVRQTIPVFHALGDTKTPVWVSAGDLVVFVALAYFLRGPLGHAGVSAAVAGSSLAQMVLLLVMLRRRLGDLASREMLPSIGKTLAASIVGAVGGASAGRVLGATALGGAAAIAVFGGLFFVVGWGLRSPEQAEIVAGVARRLRRR
ncbi:MAG: murein biosynthesis integral membrane protein MurJ [Myxococcales bacterium]|jgi:putative peptidoglycan lipid II flippase|nr:murein biosynthesis integral membrane protein MurJ [Myxococcales bacterium]